MEEGKAGFIFVERRATLFFFSSWRNEGTRGNMGLRLNFACGKEEREKGRGKEKAQMTVVCLSIC